MKLSIIIVNYNVKYFLEQCLQSVQKATQNIEAEVFVVDNNSVDRSMEMVTEKFPWVKQIQNKKNVGFSVANNQAIEKSKGGYVLLLNPDTLVEEDTFEKCISFMDNHEDAGALGVKMVDGKGNFLPESKRSLPTPRVAFYKIFGLSSLFPKSKRFAAYHLGNLSKDETNKVEILAGAYMFIRKKALDEVGLLDETFFMYGEDIDLSYRIIKGGYKNYYLSDTSIIHYKGESTKKGSLNYVFLFYKAMVVFAKKHFSSEHAAIYSLLIHSAIYLRAFLSVSKRIVNKIILPLFDFLFAFLGMLYLTKYWQLNHRYVEGGAYPEVLTHVLIPSYILIWLGVFKLSGVYDKPFRVNKLAKGSIYGLITLLVVYALTPEVYRFSRALILLGSAWAGISILLSRSLFRLMGIKAFQWGEKIHRRFLIVGQEEECIRVHQLLLQTDLKAGFIGYVHRVKPDAPHDCYVGVNRQLQEAIEIYKIDELIFCSRDLSTQKIIEQMSTIKKKNLDFKIAPKESLYIIGSNSVDTKGTYYGFELNSINKPGNLRNKRLFDILSSTVLIGLYPVLVWVNPNSLKLLKNIVSVLLGSKTWVSYGKNSETSTLPKIKDGVLSPSSHMNTSDAELTDTKLNMLYAKEYSLKNDFYILSKNLRRLS